MAYFIFGKCFWEMDNLGAKPEKKNDKKSL